MGLMGLTAGASTAGILGIVRLMGDHWLPRMASNSDRKHQMIASLQEQRHETVQHWRTGLATARDTYGSGLPVRAQPTRPTPSVTSGSRGCGRISPRPATPPASATLTKSTATTRLSQCCHWRSAASNSSGSTRPKATRGGCESRPDQPSIDAMVEASGPAVKFGPATPPAKVSAPNENMPTSSACSEFPRITGAPESPPVG